MIYELIQKYNPKKILIIDELSYFKISSSKFNIQNFYQEVKELNKEIDVYIISNEIQENLINININPEKILEVNEYFNQNNIYFDLILDINSKNMITQLSIFSLFINRTKLLYILKSEVEEKEIKLLTYNIKKFNRNIKFKDNYFFVQI